VYAAGLRSVRELYTTKSRAAYLTPLLTLQRSAINTEGMLEMLKLKEKGGLEMKWGGND